MSDEWQDWESAAIEYERERERLNAPTDPNFAEVPAKRLGCGGLLIRFVIGLILFRAILEIIGLLLK